MIRGAGALRGRSEHRPRDAAPGARRDGERRRGAAEPLPPADADDLPALAALPGGNANVFTRSLGLPTDPVDAAGRLIEDLMAGRERRIGLGTANGRYFTFNAGVGLDAEVVRAVEGRRAHGRSLTPALYIRTALRQYYQVTDRRQPGHHHRRARRAVSGRPVSSASSPTRRRGLTWAAGRSTLIRDASFDTGLDLLGVSRPRHDRARCGPCARCSAERTEPPRGRSVVARPRPPGHRAQGSAAGRIPARW